MAVRFNANNQRFTLNTSAGTVSQLSVCGWFRLAVDRNTDTAIWGLSNSADTNYLYLITTENGTTAILLSEAFTERTVGSFAVGTWTYVGVSFNGNNFTAKWREIDDSGFTTVTQTLSGASVPVQRIVLGDWLGGGGFWFNGAMAGVKIWLGKTLSAAELEQEYLQFDPIVTDNLFAYYRFATNAGTDSSGNNRHLSGGSGTTTEADPPGIPNVLGPPTVVRGWGPVPIF